MRKSPKWEFLLRRYKDDGQVYATKLLVIINHQGNANGSLYKIFAYISQAIF